jgi:hypothetical protein
MNFKFALLLLCVFCTTLFVACTKHRGDVEEQIPTAAITFTSPTENAVYKSGDSVLIQCFATASEVMHGCEITITNAADTSVTYYHEHLHDHNDTLAINHKWKDTLTTAANLQIAVTLILDHDGHTSTKTVNIKNLVP